MWHELNGATGYAAGASGTVTVPAGACVTQILAHSTAGGTVAIFGGASIPIVANAPPTEIRFNHTLYQSNSAGNTIVFTGTDQYAVFWVLQR